jgi:methionyl aminopeptidase
MNAMYNIFFVAEIPMFKSLRAHWAKKTPARPVNMGIILKSRDEIEQMRIAGRLAAEVLRMVRPHVVPGMTTAELDEICHGIPGAKRLKDGDIVNIDITVIKDGWHGDTSKMFMVGKPTIKGRRISDIAYRSMVTGIEMVKPGVRLGDIGHAIQKYAESHGCSVVREYCGHGIGKGFHEDPQVLHYGRPGTGEILVPGMVFTIEPMINLGRRDTKLLPDGWTVVTRDRSLSAQWEHTIAVTGDGHDVLTRLPEDNL